MCYDIKTSLEAQLKRAKRNLDYKAIEEIIEKLVPLTDLPVHHASGFTHPEVLIYTNESPDWPKVATWGLVPHWVRTSEQRKKLWNSTLNARGETLFEKPSFRESAQHHRAIVYVDGFYEHHHFQNNTYPFYIQQTSKEPLALAGLWSTWTDPETKGRLVTFSIVTTVGNRLMSKIHNNPKLEGPRMPLVLTEEMEEKWLHNYEDTRTEAQINELLQSDPGENLEGYPVGKLRGISYLGNVPEVCSRVEYPELELV